MRIKRYTLRCTPSFYKLVTRIALSEGTILAETTEGLSEGRVSATRAKLGTTKRAEGKHLV
jgi:hypothetical protein